MTSLSARQLDDDLRRRDPDRWLSSRFVADPAVRVRLVALYTLDGEWSRVAAAVTTALAGEIRLAWWSEALERFAEGAPADHPALAALGQPDARALRPLLERVIDARRTALETGDDAPDAGEALMLAAARLLDPAAPEAAIRAAARAWPARPAALPEANAALRGLSAAAFPAVAHATLARAYGARRTPGDLEKRWRVTRAVLTGRL